MGWNAYATSLIAAGTRVMAASIAAAVLAACATPASPPAPAPAPSLTLEQKHQKIRANWTPGGPDFIPADTLTLFPCHSEELPCGSMAAPTVQKVDFKGPVAGDAKKGEAIAINIRYGNCIACHNLPKGHQGGTIGPSLAEYAKRQMPVDYTYQRIWDIRVYNPNAFMPLYGTNAVLTGQEIQDVMAFLELGK